MKRPIIKRIISLTIITVMLITSMTVNLHAYVGEEEIIKTSEEAADELTDENSEAVSYTITKKASKHRTRLRMMPRLQSILQKSVRMKNYQMLIIWKAIIQSQICSLTNKQTQRNSYRKMFRY